MKKETLFPTIVLVIAAAVSTTLLVSCNPTTKPGSGMQKPTSDSVANQIDNPMQVEKTSSMDAKASNFQNLQDAFKGETTASAKYAAFSKKAEMEGHHEIALLFQATSISEKIHANNHLAVLEESGQTVPAFTPEFIVGTTQDNLKDAIKGESYEIDTMYPAFLAVAVTAENQMAYVSLNYAFKTEQKHKPLYEKALAALENNTVKSLGTAYYVCPTCGNTYETNAPKRCGISMTSGEKFIKVVKLNA